MSRGTLLARVSELGPAAQSIIPGLYAWGLTVLGPALGRGVPWQTRTLAALGPIVLAAAALVERERAGTARALSVFGLALSSLLVWWLLPVGHGPSDVDPVRGFLGMFGWGLFALASAAPALGRRGEDPSRVIEQGPVAARRAGVELPVLVVGALLMGLVQASGWGAEPRERALLVRAYGVVAGLAILGTFGGLALARRATRPRARGRVRALMWLGASLVAGGVALGLELSG